MTELNTVTRAIDLSCELMAPCVAGILMGYSHVIAAICIALWNVLSVFGEYALLRRIYRIVPRLAIKGVEKDRDQGMAGLDSAVSCIKS